MPNVQEALDRAGEVYSAMAPGDRELKIGAFCSLISDPCACVYFSGAFLSSAWVRVMNDATRSCNCFRLSSRTYTM